MTPIFFDSSSNNYSPYPNDHLHTHQFLNPNSQPSSSSTRSLTTHLFLSSNDQNGVFTSELHSQQYQHHEDDNVGSQPYNDNGINNMNNDLHQVKWMCSKMRVMLKMKKSNDQVPMNQNTYSMTTSRDIKLEEQETDNSSNSTSPVRVCSDCNTTKTPLWRSGPQGPKSLCNACGIRQRKARRAMAAAAAAAAENDNNFVLDDRPIITPLKVSKTHHKDHRKPIYNKGHVTKYKKRQYSKQITTTSPPQQSPSSPSLSPSPSPSPTTSSSSHPARKMTMEDYLASLSKNLTFYNVLPQDEKEAAILLMAISCGYAHET
ncbi:hypothetical protein QVD17_29597 [Tagetes erecta]|uniref:GATA-type domain-containing protein n=1 Tax=Tagetes erecta TaxID=13708 RepID=A0AAD8K3T2_TARER|nr:hypothetical protein QVD17_29597 [Tagetes erecta]